MSSTAWEKLRSATISLTRAGAMKDRMTDAYRNHLSTLAESDFPAELRDDFRIMHDALTREPPTIRGDDAFRATVRKMSNGEAEEVASWIVQLFCALPRGPQAVVHRERATGLAQLLPLYVAENRAVDTRTAETRTATGETRTAETRTASEPRVAEG